jgi:GNAT superfamily N-acetyltransferase
VRHGTRRSYFGFFDCADDVEAAQLLLGAAEEWGRTHGATEIAGNFNLTAMQQLGIVTAGFESAPYSDMVYNPPWIPRLLEAAGYTPFFPMSTHELHLNGFDPVRLRGPRQQALLARSDLRWQPLTRRHLHRDLSDARQLLNASFDPNPMFVPVSEEEFRFQAADLMWIVDERLACVVRDRANPIGVVVCIPDVNPFLRTVRSRLGPLSLFHFLRHRWAVRRAVILYWAVRPDRQSEGYTGAMLWHVLSALRAAGYHSVGLTWIADVNGPSLRQVEKLGARRLHRLHLFGKQLA